MTNKTNYGLVISKEKDLEAYVLGGVSSLPKEVIRPDGNWLPFVPSFEPQARIFDTSNCTGFNTVNPIEIILRSMGITENYSDRWVGIIAGTKPPGNDPHIVAEAIRKHGLIPESMLPFSEDLKNVDEYYSFKGANEDECRKAGKEWLEKWDFGHEWVFEGGKDKQKKMIEALTFSPLGVSVDAWQKRNGLFYKEKGESDNHWTSCIVGYALNKHWIIADTYLDDGEPIKKLEWDYDFGFVKRYRLKKKTDKKVKSAFCTFLSNYFEEIWK